MKITFTPDRRFAVREIVLDKNTVDSLLAINVKNRSRSRGREAVYKASFEEGRWCFANPMAMSFTVNESMTWLIDGQTRLEAIRQSGAFDIHALLHIVRDEDAEAVFRTIDLGRARTCGSTLALLGITHANMKAAAIRMLYAFVEKSSLMDHGILNDMTPMINPIFDALPYRDHKGTKQRPPAVVYAAILNAIRLSLITVDDAAKLLEDASADRGDEQSAERALSRCFQTFAVLGPRRLNLTETICTITNIAERYTTRTPVKIIRYEKKYEAAYRVATPSIPYLVEVAEAYVSNHATK